MIFVTVVYGDTFACNADDNFIKMEQRRAYLETLALSDEGNLAPFTELVARSLLNTQQNDLAGYERLGMKLWPMTNLIPFIPEKFYSKNF